MFIFVKRLLYTVGGNLIAYQPLEDMGNAAKVFVWPAQVERVLMKSSN